MIALDACVQRALAGPKAVTLARLRAAGVPAPDGVVILPDEDTDAAAFPAELSAALERLGEGAFAVRSSSSMEDRQQASGAGVFESMIGARGLEGVMVAIARVRASAQAAPAQAYLRARGLDAAALRMAVLIQPRVRAERLGVARSANGGFVVEERAASEPEWSDVEAREIAAGDDSPLAVGLRQIAALLGGDLDVEYALTGTTVSFLQARPLARVEQVAPDAVFHAAGHWRRDAEHNPAPLSAAQAGLVERVEALGVGPRQRVIGGYLFVERGAPRGEKPIPLPDLVRRFHEEIAPECEARLAACEDGAELEPALEAFCQVYARYVGAVSPSLSRAWRELDQVLRMNLGEPLAEHGALLSGTGGLTVERDQSLWQLGRAAPAERPALLSAHLVRFGAYAPAWDVSVAPDDEAPDRVLAQAARLALLDRSPATLHAEAEAQADHAASALLERIDRMGRRAFKALLPRVRDVLPLAEDDDALFFRAQRAVRRALLSQGRVLWAAARLDTPDDIFDLPLAPDANADLRALAAQNRASRLSAARRPVPLAIDNGRPSYPAPAAREVLRGFPTAGTARGPAVIIRSPADAPATLSPGSILIVPAILPSLTYLLPGAAALITDHGGAHSHGATLAREYGVPAVLGTRRATTLAPGTDLYIDATTGRIYVL